MADEREQGRQRECEAMGHVWPKRPTCGVFRNHPKPAVWRDLFEHAEWTEACERCCKQAEVSVFLCEVEPRSVELLRRDVALGLFVDAEHWPLNGPTLPRGVVHALGPMRVVIRWRLATANYQPRSDRG